MQVVLLVAEKPAYNEKIICSYKYSRHQSERTVFFSENVFQKDLPIQYTPFQLNNRHISLIGTVRLLHRNIQALMSNGAHNGQNYK